MKVTSLLVLGCVCLGLGCTPSKKGRSPMQEKKQEKQPIKVQIEQEGDLIMLKTPHKQFEELSIVVNPVDQNCYTAGAQVPLYYFTTQDDGTTWKYAPIRNGATNVLGDPALTADKKGNVYMIYIGGWRDSGIYCQVSNDKGLTFSGKSADVLAHKGLVPFEDKAYPCTDLTDNPTQNNLYVAWTQFSRYRGTANMDAMYQGFKDSSIILFSRSTDLGKTFDTPIRLDTKAGSATDDDNTNEGAVPAVGPKGEVYVTWASAEGLQFVSSTDAGKTFSKPVRIEKIPQGWDLDISGVDRSNGMPITGCDIAPKSPYKGTIYVNWADQRNGAENTDVFLMKSTDGGKTWSKPKNVKGDKGKRHQFLTWMSVDPISGYVYIVFYDRFATQGDATEVTLAISKDGGETFTHQTISKTAFTPYKSDFFGDYIGISAYNGTVRPFWMHWQNHSSTLYLKKYQEKLGN